ncbi:MAG: hypothetical protein KKB70_03950, partial [Proteobacteria bacterium]|nr:hypothetical protein [Pseudomonadota bacterium]MBU1612690.1 hypothetical protein [Pseudomonadota bacterium]
MTMLDSGDTSKTEVPDNTPGNESSSGKTEPRAPRKARQDKHVSALGLRLARIVNPNKWSLRARFVYTTGFLLLLGVVTTLVLVTYTLTQSAEDSVNGRLDSFAHQLDRNTLSLQASLLDAAANMAAMDNVINAMGQKDLTALQQATLPISDRVRLITGHPAPHLQFFGINTVPLLNTWSLQALGDERRQSFDMIQETEQEVKSLTGYQVLPDGPTLSATVPVLQDNLLVGTVEATATIADMFRQMSVPAHYGLGLLLDVTYLNILDQNTISDGSGDYLVVGQFGLTDMDRYGEQLDKTGLAPDRIGHFFIRTIPFSNFDGEHIGELVLFYDGTEIMTASNWNVNLLIWMAIGGSLLLWTALYLNVKRIRDFFSRMKKVIIASHASDFAERFESDSMHCLDILHCPNKECPVYQDPTRVCYLETGDEAISPKWRNSCIFLNKYKTCSGCPVYKLRQGDELMEMRHVVNTMMRLWSTFLSQVGNLLEEVLRTSGGRRPGLDDVSRYLEQLAGLTVFGHDLQGVYDKSEVHRQLEYVFEHQFGLTRFNLLEVNASDNRMTPVINRYELDDSHRDVFINCEMCRTKRVAEDVISATNPVLCPYFDIN